MSRVRVFFFHLVHWQNKMCFFKKKKTFFLLFIIFIIWVSWTFTKWKYTLRNLLVGVCFRFVIFLFRFVALCCRVRNIHANAFHFIKIEKGVRALYKHDSNDPNNAFLNFFSVLSSNFLLIFNFLSNIDLKL